MSRGKRGLLIVGSEAFAGSAPEGFFFALRDIRSQKLRPIGKRRTGHRPL